MAITEAKAALRSICFIFSKILFLFWKKFERLLKLFVTVNIVKFLVLFSFRPFIIVKFNLLRTNFNLHS